METVVRPSPPIAASMRRGLSRVEAAQYIGVSATTFDKMVKDGNMLIPKRAYSRTIWDVRALDLAFDNLPSDDAPIEINEWD